MENNDIQIKQLSNKDLLLFQGLIQLFNEVFEAKEKDVPGTSYLTSLLSKPNFKVIAVLYQNELAGGLTVYELPLYTAESSEIYLYDIAIKNKFQRKGLGSALLTALKGYCNENNIKQFFVEAHASDQEAVDFYKKAGGNAEEVVHFNFTANE